MATSWVSHITGPIPGHKIYEHNEKQHYEKSYKKFNKCILDSNNLNVKGKGYLGSLSNRATTPKDHIQENVKRIREIQRASRMRQEENRQNRGPLKSTSRPSSCVSTPGRSSRHQNSMWDKSTMVNNAYEASPKRVKSASSVLKLSLGDNDNNCTYENHRVNNKSAGYAYNNTVQSHRGYLRAHEKTGPPLELSTYPISPIPKHPREEKLTVPKATTAREVQLIRRDVDFVKANAYAAKSSRMKRSPSADSLLSLQNKQSETLTQYKRGEVPSYLVKRKQQWQEDEETFIASQPDPDQPPGHRKMSEKERKATLELLKSTEKDMLAELGKLPIRTDTLKLKTRKQEIEQKLNELEEAIKIFSKPKVFIRVDD